MAQIGRSSGEVPGEVPGTHYLILASPLRRVVDLGFGPRFARRSYGNAIPNYRTPVDASVIKHCVSGIPESESA